MRNIRIISERLHSTLFWFRGLLTRSRLWFAAMIYGTLQLLNLWRWTPILVIFSAILKVLNKVKSSICIKLFHRIKILNQFTMRFLNIIRIIKWCIFISVIHWSITSLGILIRTTLILLIKLLSSGYCIIKDLILVVSLKHHH